LYEKSKACDCLHSPETKMNYPTLKTFAEGSELPPTTPGKLRLYSMRFCPYAQRTRLVLAYKGIDFETVNVHLKKKPSWFLERNPLGLVPVLEKDDQIVYESTATMDWLDDVYPGKKLVPSDPYRKAWDRILQECFGKVTSNMFALRSAEDKEKHVEGLHKAFDYYEKILVQRGGPFFGGAAPCMFDLFAWPHMERLPALVVPLEPRAAVDKAQHPMLHAWFQAMYGLPAVQATMFDHETHRKFFKSFMDDPMNPSYDIGLEE